MMDLGTLGGFPTVGHSINNRGQITGQFVDEHSLGHAFLYSGGIMYALNDIVSSGVPNGVLLYEAWGINDNGWIIANGYNSMAYLLQPVAEQPVAEQPVAEPASLVLFVVGTAALEVHRRIKRVTRELQGR